MVVDFESPVSEVSLRVGLAEWAESELGGTWARLMLFGGAGGSGSLLGQSLNLNPVGPDVQLSQPISTLVAARVDSGLAVAASAVVVVGHGTFSHDNTPTPVTIDDLTFTDGSVAPPVIPPPPQVQISTPASGSYFQAPVDVRVSGRVTAPAGLAALCVAADAVSFPPARCDNQVSNVGLDGVFRDLHVAGLTPGNHAVAVWATDSRARTSHAEVSVSVGTAAGAPDVRVQGIEISQAVDPLPLPVVTTTSAAEPGLPTHRVATGASVPLVAGRKTIVRVYADAASLSRGASPPHDVRMLLYGFYVRARGSVRSFGPPITPIYQPRQLALSAFGIPWSTRLDPGGAYTFVLPSSWTGGNLRLVAWLNPPGAPHLTECVGCGGADNLLGLSTRFFFATGVIKITPVALTQPSGDSFSGVTYPEDPQLAFREARKVAPIADDRFQVLPYAGFVDVTAILRCAPSDVSRGWCSGASDRRPDVMAALDAWRGSHTYTGKVYGLGYGVGGSTHWSHQFAFSDPRGRPLSAVAHELFHMFDVAHASRACGGGTGGQVGVDWPPDQIGLLQGVGIDPTTGSGRSTGPFAILGGPGTLDDPNVPVQIAMNSQGQLTANGATDGLPWVDFMSYCFVYNGDPATWLSPRNWSAALQAVKPGGSWFGGRPAFEHPDASSTELAPPLRQRIVVHAVVNSDGSGRIIALQPGAGKVSLSAGKSDYRVVVRAADGSILASIPAEVHEVHVDRSALLRLIDVAVPGGKASAIELVGPTGVLDTRSRPASPPEIRLTLPRPGTHVANKGTLKVAWQLGQSGKVVPTVRLEVSLNAGHRWRTLAEHLTETKIALPARLVPASNKVRLRVVASDGFRTDSATSPLISSAGASPTVGITDPRSGAIIRSDAVLELTGEAADDRGSVLTGQALTWRDGARLLGHGASVTIRGLQPGVRTIRLTARDRLGRRTSRSLQVHVIPVAPAFVILRSPRLLSPRATRTVIRVATTAPATLQVGKLQTQVGPKLRSITVKFGARREPVRLPLTLLNAAGKTSTVLTIPRR